MKLETRLRNFNIEPYISFVPLGARSAVDILTDNGLEDEIAALKALLKV